MQHVDALSRAPVEPIEINVENLKILSHETREEEILIF